jgi:hypothetical protein
MVREFNMVGDSDLEPARSVYPLEPLLHVPIVNDLVERELTYVVRVFYKMVALVRGIGFDASLIFFTDCSKGGVGTGYGVYHSGGPESSFRLREPSGMFTSETSAIFVALIQIRARHLDRYLVVTDSMSSLKALQTRSGGLL